MLRNSISWCQRFRPESRSVAKPAMASSLRLEDAVSQLVLCLQQCEAELRAVSNRLSEEFSRRPFQQTVSRPAAQGCADIPLPAL